MLLPRLHCCDSLKRPTEELNDCKITGGKGYLRLHFRLFCSLTKPTKAVSIRNDQGRANIAHRIQTNDVIF